MCCHTSTPHSAEPSETYRYCSEDLITMTVVGRRLSRCNIHLGSCFRCVQQALAAEMASISATGGNPRKAAQVRGASFLFHGQPFPVSTQPPQQKHAAHTPTFINAMLCRWKHFRPRLMASWRPSVLCAGTL
jgi:hypothetical protein